eukprot:1941468-Amphidinium_carterae.1
MDFEDKYTTTNRQISKVIGLQRTVSTYHTRLSALEQSVAALQENATATDDRVDQRFRQINEHAALVDDILGSHTSSIQKLGSYTAPSEETRSFSTVWLAQLVHAPYELRADANQTHHTS